jgi:hypothetical protein
MKAYKIHRWDSILPPNSSNALPMVYISPDIDLIKFAQNNNYCFEVEIRCSNSIYDGHRMLGTFDSLLLGPNCYSKIMKDKNWYTISLTSYFYKYPPQMGEIMIIGMNDETGDETGDEKGEEINNEIVPVSTRDIAETKLIGMNILQIGAVLLIFITLILIIFVFNKNK